MAFSYILLAVDAVVVRVTDAIVAVVEVGVFCAVITIAAFRAMAMVNLA